MLDFRMETFLTVCKCMNFTRASEKLNITQPAVSQHIRFLEKHYNTKLFRYEGKKLRLTGAGEILRNASLTMMHDEQSMQNEMQKTEKEAEIRFGPEVLGFDQKKTDSLVKFAAEITGLESGLDENPYNLPLSIRKFVTIASVIAMDVDIFVLDEPTAGQDQYGIQTLEKILNILREKGKTIITITHDMEYVVNNFQKVMVMAHKNLLCVDHPRKVFTQDDLLKESMLIPPYISLLVKDLGINKEILTQEEFIEYYLKQ